MKPITYGRWASAEERARMAYTNPAVREALIAEIVADMRVVERAKDSRFRQLRRTRATR